MKELSPFDPTPTQDLTDPLEWFAQHRIGGPDMGSLLLLQPERAAEVLAAQGVPPPPRGGRTGGAAIPTQGPGPSQEAQAAPTARTPGAYPSGTGPEPPPKVQDRVPAVPQRPMSATPGVALEPQEEYVPPTPTGAPLDIRPGVQREPSEDNAGKVPKPGGLAQALQGLKAIAPPQIYPVSTPSPPSPRVDATPNIRFADAPRMQAGNIPVVNPQSMVQLFQQLQRGGGANPLLLSALLGRR